jgi:hypothetical protein
MGVPNCKHEEEMQASGISEGTRGRVIIYTIMGAVRWEGIEVRDRYVVSQCISRTEGEGDMDMDVKAVKHRDWINIKLYIEKVGRERGVWEKDRGRRINRSRPRSKIQRRRRWCWYNRQGRREDRKKSRYVPNEARSID